MCWQAHDMRLVAELSTERSDRLLLGALNRPSSVRLSTWSDHRNVRLSDVPNAETPFPTSKFLNEPADPRHFWAGTVSRECRTALVAGLLI